MVDNLGSGIYLGKDGYVKVISETKKSNVLVVAEIPKVINRKRTQNANDDRVHVYEFTKDEISTGEEEAFDNVKYYLLRDNLSPYTTKLIDHRQRVHNETLCDRNFCCDFKVTINYDEKIAQKNSNYYR